MNTTNLYKAILEIIDETIEDNRDYEESHPDSLNNYADLVVGTGSDRWSNEDRLAGSIKTQFNIDLSKEEKRDLYDFLIDGNYYQIKQNYTTSSSTPLAFDGVALQEIECWIDASYISDELYRKHGVFVSHPRVNTFMRLAERLKDRSYGVDAELRSDYALRCSSYDYSLLGYISSDAIIEVVAIPQKVKQWLAENRATDYRAYEDSQRKATQRYGFLRDYQFAYPF